VPWYVIQCANTRAAARAALSPLLGYAPFSHSTLYIKIDFDTSLPASEETQGRGCPAKSHEQGAATQQVSARCTTAASAAAANARAAAFFPPLSTLAPRPEDDRGLLGNFNLPASPSDGT